MRDRSLASSQTGGLQRGCDLQCTASLYGRGTVLVALSIALVVSVLALPGRTQTAPECADPVPVDEIAAGMTGQGVTVERGNAPSPFDAEVLGVLQDGIAPGIDLIIADLESPAVARAGIWAGMSGSPVYDDDGRLIGAANPA